ncbi:hypothetical protein FEM48_Zijuj10G0019600 [Ziziphus jujuba var. spinosa]|uniref:WRKY domain-containing protein n=1 Tax=Ziziphus jujuba var. spinosa TaxID=714518 RepID=A0A978UKM1_ZIZJJ|nr:hypothetical protein FEM48_Zijuj10G0019600 [Ziziphus jujuba var. spinosa]
METRDLKHIWKNLHSGRYEHDLSFYEEGSLIGVSKICHKCRQPVSRDYYKCTAKGCADEYYLHKECTELKYLSQEYHPLHPQHPLAGIDNNNFPYFKSFICSFCRETCRWDEISGQCSDDQCDFTLHDSCATEFLDKPELLNKYEIDQHFLHNHENHWLS